MIKISSISKVKNVLGKENYGIRFNNRFEGDKRNWLDIKIHNNKIQKQFEYVFLKKERKMI